MSDVDASNVLPRFLLIVLACLTLVAVVLPGLVVLPP